MNPARRLTRGIYLRGNFYWLSIQKDKKRHFISLGTRDFQKAISKAAEIRHSPVVESGELVPHAVVRFVRHMRERNLWTRASEDSKGYVLRAFSKWIGSSVPAAVTESDVRRWYEERRKKHSDSTAHGNLMTVRSFFNWCRDSEKCVRENPCAALRIKAPPSIGRREFCTPNLRDRLIAECEREDIRFVLFCGFHAGLRTQEIVEARPFWFDLKAGLLHLRKTETMQFKDREERTIPLTAAFRDFIGGYGLREPFMLHPEKEHSKNRYRYDFTVPFRNYMRAQGCEWVTHHTMRHTFASLLASAGVSIYKIAVWLGDDVRVVQKHYAKLLPGDTDIEKAFHSSSSDRKASRPARSTVRR